MQKTLIGLLAASDQAAALTGVAYLDHALEILLKASFRTLTTEEQTRMFDGRANGILGTITSKIRTAYAMRLIEPIAYRDLLLINDIRNVFAHTLHDVSFMNELVKEDCSKLRSSKPRGVQQLPRIAKEQYLWAVLNLYFDLRTAVERYIVAKVLAEPPTFQRSS